MPKRFVYILIMNRILIVGGIKDNHLKRLIHNIRKHDQPKELIIDSFNIVAYEHEADSNYNNQFYIKKHFGKWLYNIKYLRYFIHLFDIYYSFFKIPFKYDLINIHYVTNTHYLLFPLFKLKSRKIMITPWGSDVYRIDNKTTNKFQRLYKHSDFVSVPPIKFKDDIKNKFRIGEDKIIDLGFGSEIIDLLINNKKSQSEAKKALDCLNYYLITCGYNRNPAQNHIAIIDGLIKIKKNLPPNTMLLFPLTYGPQNENYLIELKKLLDESGFKYKLFESYLSNDDIMNIRIASDIFIHIQNTDAYSATVQEFLYTNTWVINGDWTRYPTLEINEIPYITVNYIKEFPEQIIKYISYDKSSTLISSRTKEIIAKNSWTNKSLYWYLFYKNLK